MAEKSEFGGVVVDYSKLPVKIYAQMYAKASEIWISSQFDSYTSSELMAAFSLLLYEYSKSVAAGWDLTPTGIDDAISVSDEREELHRLTSYLTSKGAWHDVDRLRELDMKWQRHLLESIEDGDVKAPIYPRSREPSSKWWHHIETLNTLSDFDRSTL